MKIAGYETHPAADLFPMLDEERFASLKESISANGQRDPVTLFEGKILDGRNRAKACAELGAALKTLPFVGDPWEFVWDKNGERRDLSPGQRAAIRIRFDEEINRIKLAVQDEANRKRAEAQRGVPKAEAKERAGSRDPARPRDRGGSKTAQAVAARAKVSTATAKRALELKKKAPALFEQVANGEAELNATLREVKRKEKYAEIAEQSRSMPLVDEVRPCPVVYADPPWEYENMASAGAAADQYPTMSLEDICTMKVPATKDAVLFMWATSPLLAKAFQVISAWGFTYKGSMVWDKDVGTGSWVLNCHELLLIAVRGDIPCPAPENRPKSVVHSKRGPHSAKPDEFAALIERMYPTLPRIEMFARGLRENWLVWGNQAA